MRMPPAPDDAPRSTRATKVIAVADVVESVRLMEQDEHEFIRRWQRFVGFVEQRLPSDGGRIHKSLGDGLMLEFSDPHGCVRCALAMLAWLAEVNQPLPPEDQVQLRIGAHLAEFVADEYDIYGTDVNLAARIASLAGPGEIVISAALREHVGPQASVPLQDLGSCHLKHVKEPVHAFRIGEAGQAPVLPVRRLATHSLRPTIAVLPFGMQGAPAAEGLTGEALADDIVAALAGSDLLQVVSRLSSAHFGRDKAALDEVRRGLGAHYVLTGRARGGAANLSLYVELAEAASGHVAWAQTFQGPLREAELGEGRLMRQVVAAVHSAVLAHEVDRSRDAVLPALEGFTLLLSSIGLMHRLAPADLQRAHGMLEHLVERGRGHAAPHAWLAHLHVLWLRQLGAGGGGDALAARQHATAALQCDPGSVRALTVQGQVLLYGAQDAEAAHECYAQALSARPDDALALVLQAELRALQGDGEAARELCGRALDGIPLVEPMRYLHEAVAALAALVGGDTGAAVGLARRALERNPRYLGAWRLLAVGQVLDGQLEAARRSARRLAAHQLEIESEAQASAAMASMAPMAVMPPVAAMLPVAVWPACCEVAERFSEALRQAGVAVP
jgi:class 3 adenylate cyclase/TolB-like protein